MKTIVKMEMIGYAGCIVVLDGSGDE